MARLIRSKGVGVFFVTHAPADVPDEVLGQLGNRVQHALRAFTPDDLKVVKATAETFPMTEFYEVERELTQLGIGEALVTALNPKGVPMPTARTMMRPPMSLMAQLDPDRVRGGGGSLDHRRQVRDRREPRVRGGDAASRADAGSSAGSAERPSHRVSDPAKKPSGGAKRLDPRAGARDDVDWGDVAKEGSRVARSGAFNTILKSILRGFAKR